jgi:hypothetical protein
LAAPTKRIDGIDFWRGFALLTIFIDHVPENIFQHVTQKNFGFSDAAELFVFLSGVSVALAYGTRFFDGEAVVAVRAVLRRAFTLYWVPILISLLIIAMFAGAAALWDDDNLLEDADAVVSNPLQTTAAIVLWSGTSRPVSHITSTLRPFKNLKRWHADIAVRPSASA